MQSKVVRTLALVLLLCGTGVGLAQQQPKPKKVRVEVEEEKAVPRAKQKSQPEKSKLEEILAEALKNSPDIRVAVAKLAMAEAELNQARLQVMQKVYALHASSESQKAEVEFRQKQYERFKELAAQGSIDSKLLDEALAKLTAAKGKLAELEAQMSGLLGKSPQAEYSLTIQEAKLVRQEAIRSSIKTRRTLIEEAEWKMAYKIAGPMAEKLRKALQTPVEVDYKEIPLREVLKDLEKKAPGLSFHVRDVPQQVRRGELGEAKLDLHFSMPLPMASILQAIQDEVGSRFIVRDYGILVTSVVEPRGAVTVEEFLRQKPAGESRHQSSSGKNPPVESVEGVVQAVDDSSGSLYLSIGRNVGLAKGHTLELFRLVPPPGKPRYLGTIRIYEVKAKESVAKAVGKLADQPLVGDRVASKLEGK